MKQFRFLSALVLMAGTFFFSSCNGDEKKTEDKTVSKDSAAVTTSAPGCLMVIRHKVANYAAWLPAYEAHDSARLSYGIHSFLLARGTKDSNTVMVVLRADDTAKARQFSMLPDLKLTMQKAGVIGAPTIQLMNVQWRDTTSNVAKTRVLITHKVKDWDAWKKSFDSHKQIRVDAGLADRLVGYDVADNHSVSVALIINDVAKAEAFMNSKDLKDRMAEGGVVGPPDVFFYTVVKNY